MLRRASRVSITAALVLATCYLGASIGTWLRFPGIGAAVLFPPYAVLTAALLRNRSRHWWIIFLAGAAGDFLPHRFGGASVGFVLAAEAVNLLRALVAALALRRFCGPGGRVETLRQLAAYLGFAVFLAPGVAALGGAWLVTWHGTPGFWLAWQEWWLSNAITGLTVLPLLILGLPERATVTRRDLLEGILLATALLVVGIQVFDKVRTSQAHLFWPLPFLLWAAVRFGLRSICSALLCVTCLSIWGVLNGRGPFIVQPPADSLLEMHMFVLAISMPLLLVAVLLAEQRRTVAALAESRRQYQSVVQDQTELICRFRPDGTCTFANRAYCETFGIAHEDLIGASIWSRVPAGLHRSRAELAELTAAAPIAAREVNLPQEGKVPRWLQWRDRALFDDRGVIVEYQSVGRDISDRKRAEDDQRELETRRSVEAALRESDRRKDEFLAMLGHELRNPLAPIRLAIEILRDAQPGNPNAVWARESIARQLGHMTRLLDDLLDISRVTLGKIRLQITPVDLDGVIASAVETTGPFIESFRHRLRIDLPAGKRFVIQGDAVRLAQVVANLLNNAAKYTDPGGKIEIRVEEEAGGVRLAVRDNGIGLAADALARIFDLFSQVHAGRERAHGGLGIGLTLVKRLVELHGGSVEAGSEGPGHGTEISVHLPAAVQPLVKPAPPPMVLDDKPSQGSLRVLAVDDNVEIAEALAIVLGAWGHAVRVAHDGHHAVAVATSFAPEVVLVDLGLPEMDGLEVARRIQPSLRHALLISMSGFGGDETHRRSSEAGFRHHLVKPFDVEALRLLLDDYVRGSGRD